MASGGALTGEQRSRSVVHELAHGRHLEVACGARNATSRRGRCGSGGVGAWLVGRSRARAADLRYGNNDEWHRETPHLLAVHLVVSSATERLRQRRSMAAADLGFPTSVAQGKGRLGFWKLRAWVAAAP
jgi:uncharacterized low-complexity protein